MYSDVCGRNGRRARICNHDTAHSTSITQLIDQLMPHTRKDLY